MRIARRQLREGPLARRVGLAVGEELVERTLRVARGEHGQTHIHRRDAVEDHRADVFAVATEVDERGSRSVRPAVQVDAVVAQMRADLVQVVHRDVGRIETDVGVVSRETTLQAIETRVARLGHLAQRVRVRSAVQRIRLPGATLIDQDDVPRSLHGAEGRANLSRQLRGPLSRPAGQEDQRITCHRPYGRQDDDPEPDLAAGLSGAILEYRQRPAVGIGRTLGTRAGMKTVEGPVAWPARARRGASEGQQRQEAGEESREA